MGGAYQKSKQRGPGEGAEVRESMEGDGGGVRITPEGKAKGKKIPRLDPQAKVQTVAP